MSFFSRKVKLRVNSFLHPIRTLKALYFIHCILPTDKWKVIVDTDRKKALDMKWNRFYRRKFPWKHPRTLNEKLTWLAAMTDTSKWTEYSDKYEVRKYIESLGLKDILTECYGVWDRAEDIDFESLPDKFVVKCTHDCESTIVVRDKSKMNKEEVVNFLNKHLAVRYGYESCEPHYIPIKPRVMAESLIEMDNSSEFSSMTLDTKFDFFDLEWNHLPIRNGHENNPNPIKKPKNFEKMIEIAEKIAQGFLQVRVDLYNVKGKIFFGEMTFFACSGMYHWFTPEFQRMIGDRIPLPKV